MAARRNTGRRRRSNDTVSTCEPKSIAICAAAPVLIVSAAAVRNIGKRAVIVAIAIGSIVPRVDAAWVVVEAPVEVTPGWTRIAGHYGSDGREPVFRAIVRCGGGDAATKYPLDARVYLAPADGALWIDLPGTPDDIRRPDGSCATPALSIEMMLDETVAATAPISRPESPADGLAAAIRSRPPAAIAAPRRFTFKGQKYGSEIGKRTEAGLDLAIDSRVSIQLNYERTAEAPMMRSDHDDGILTRLRVAF